MSTRNKKDYRDVAVDFLKSHEGFRRDVYYDQNEKEKKGIPTVGYGFTKHLMDEFLATDRSKEAGEKILRRLVGEYEDRFRNNLPNWDKLNDSQKAFFLVFGHQRPYFYNYKGTKSSTDKKIYDALSTGDFNSIPDLLDYGLGNANISRGMANRYRDMKSLYFNESVPSLNAMTPLLEEELYRDKLNRDRVIESLRRQSYNNTMYNPPIQPYPTNPYQGYVPSSPFSYPYDNMSTNVDNSILESNIQSVKGLFDNKFEKGGLMEFNTGGKHNENPYGGIPVTYDPEGNPNLVEEGETKFDNYIFSDTVTPINEEVLSKYKIPTKYLGKTYAQISKEMTKESKERPNDIMYNKYKKYILNNLKLSQEESKAIQARLNNQNVFDNGGYINVPKLNRPTYAYPISGYDPRLDPNYTAIDTALPDVQDEDYVSKVLKEIRGRYNDVYGDVKNESKEEFRPQDERNIEDIYINAFKTAIPREIATQDWNIDITPNGETVEEEDETVDKEPEVITPITTHSRQTDSNAAQTSSRRKPTPDYSHYINSIPYTDFADGLLRKFDNSVAESLKPFSKIKRGNKNTNTQSISDGTLPTDSIQSPIDSLSVDSLPLRDSLAIDSVIRKNIGKIDSINNKIDSLDKIIDSINRGKLPIDSLPIDSIPIDTIRRDSIPTNRNVVPYVMPPTAVSLDSIRKDSLATRDIVPYVMPSTARYKDSVSRDSVAGIHSPIDSVIRDSLKVSPDSTKKDTFSRKDTVKSDSAKIKVTLDSIRETFPTTGNNDYSDEYNDVSPGFVASNYEALLAPLSLASWGIVSRAINKKVLQNSKRLRNHLDNQSKFKKAAYRAGTYLDPTLYYRTKNNVSLKRLKELETERQSRIANTPSNTPIEDSSAESLEKNKQLQEQLLKGQQRLQRRRQARNKHEFGGYLNTYAAGGDLNSRIRSTLNLPNFTVPEFRYNSFRSPLGTTYGNPTFNTGNTNTEDTNKQGIFDGIKGTKSMLRYAPAIGAGIQFLGDILGQNKPDFSDAERIEKLANNSPITSFNPITERMDYTPFDREYHANKLQNQINASRDAILRSSNGNSASAHAGLLMNDYNGQSQLGQLYRQADEYNNSLRNQATQFNAGVSQFNRQGEMQAQAANAQRHNAMIQAYINSANLRQREAALASQARSNNFTNFVTSVGNIGREIYNRNVANSMSKRYNIDSNGALAFLKAIMS